MDTTPQKLADWLQDKTIYLWDSGDEQYYASPICEDIVPMLRQQQAKLDKYEQVLQSIANEHIELSHDKIKWQCEDHVRWAKEALK